MIGCLLVSGCQGAGSAPRAEVTTTTHATPDERTGTGRPVSIAVPAAGIDARVVPVGLRADRTMEVPGVDLAGWYEPGPRPGQAGPAVIVGHVERVERVPEEALPTERIWDHTREPVLRLLTCGGSFDRSTGHYRDNVIVSATATS